MRSYKVEPFTGKTVVCLPDFSKIAQSEQARELVELMRERGMVALSDLLEGKVEQMGRLDVDEIYRLGQAVGMQSGKHGDSPLPPKEVWVRLSDVTKRPLQPVDGRCKLSSVLVKDIRNAHDAGESIRSLARSYELSASTVSKIVHRHTWKNLS